jgi:hypothetical protein
MALPVSTPYRTPEVGYCCLNNDLSIACIAMTRRTAEKGMNDPRRVELRSSIRARSPSAQAGRKVATGFLAGFIISVMIVWFGFLGWGVVATFEWLLDHIKGFSSPRF